MKNLSFQKFIGACLESNAEDGRKVQPEVYSPELGHSGAKKTARTLENIEAVRVGGCESRSNQSPHQPS